MISIEDAEYLDNREKELNNELDLQLDKNCKDAEATFRQILSSELYRDAAELLREEFDAKLKRLQEDEKRKAKEIFNSTVSLQKKKLESCKDMNLKQKEVMSFLSGKIKPGSPINELDKIFDDAWDDIYSQEKANYENSLKISKERIDVVIKDHLSKWKDSRTLPANQQEPVIPEVTEDDIVAKSIEASFEKAIEKTAYELLPTAAANEACKQLFHECQRILESFYGLDFNESQVNTVFEMVEDFFSPPSTKPTETADCHEPSSAVKNQGRESLKGVRFKKDFIDRYLEAIGSLTRQQLVIFSEDFINRTHAYSADKKRLKDVILRCGNNECLLATYIIDEIERAAFLNLEENALQTLDEHHISVMNQKNFMKQLLIDLANKGDFEEYAEFFGDFKKFCGKKIDSYMQPFFEKGKICSIIASFNKDIKAMIKKVQKDIYASFEDSNDAPEKLITNFSSKLDGKIRFSQDAALNYFRNMRKDASVQGLKPIVDQLIADLDMLHEGRNSEIADKVKSCLEEKCKKEMFEHKQSGCSEKCPFCSAPCLEQAKDHSKHKSLHYPIGVRGTAVNDSFFGKVFKWGSATYEGLTSKERNFKLVLECCPSLIQSDKRFRSQYTDTKFNRWYHKALRAFNTGSLKYKDYQKEFPDWQIPSLGEMKQNDNDYWYWLMANFGEKFANKFSFMSCNLPGLEIYNKSKSSG